MQFHKVLLDRVDGDDSILYAVDSHQAADRAREDFVPQCELIGCVIYFIHHILLAWNIVITAFTISIYFRSSLMQQGVSSPDILSSQRVTSLMLISEMNFYTVLLLLSLESPLKQISTLLWLDQKEGFMLSNLDTLSLCIDGYSLQRQARVFLSSNTMQWVIWNYLVVYSISYFQYAMDVMLGRLTITPVQKEGYSQSISPSLDFSNSLFSLARVFLAIVLIWSKQGFLYFLSQFEKQTILFLQLKKSRGYCPFISTAPRNPLQKMLLSTSRSTKIGFMFILVVQLMNSVQISFLQKSWSPRIRIRGPRTLLSRADFLASVRSKWWLMNVSIGLSAYPPCSPDSPIPISFGNSDSLSHQIVHPVQEQMVAPSPARMVIGRLGIISAPSISASPSTRVSVIGCLASS